MQSVHLYSPRKLIASFTTKIDILITTYQLFTDCFTIPIIKLALIFICILSVIGYFIHISELLNTSPRCISYFSHKSS